MSFRIVAKNKYLTLSTCTYDLKTVFRKLLLNEKETYILILFLTEKLFQKRLMFFFQHYNMLFMSLV